MSCAPGYGWVKVSLMMLMMMSLVSQPLLSEAVSQFVNLYSLLPSLIFEA